MFTRLMQTDLQINAEELIFVLYKSSKLSTLPLAIPEHSSPALNINNYHSQGIFILPRIERPVPTGSIHLNTDNSLLVLMFEEVLYN